MVLNGVDSSWEKIYSGVPQGSVLGPLLFLIYINDLTDNISSRIKLFADDSSLFLRVRDINEAQALLSADLVKITEWANTWKMQFNPDITKQAIEVIFSSKYKKGIHPPLVFNGIPVARNESTKHLGMILDEKLSFKMHISDGIIKAKKGLSLLKFLSMHLNREKLDLAYKMYVRPLLEYGDIIFHETSQESMDLLESVQYQAGLIVAGCWKGTSREKLYKELGWESLTDRRRLHRLTLYQKVKTNEAPAYLSEYIITSVPTGTDRYKATFFPYCYHNWDLLDISLKSEVNIEHFISNFIKSIRPQKSDYFKICDRLGLSLHRFRHSFNCPSPVCSCSLEEETTEHYLLRFPRFSGSRVTLKSNLVAAINPEILNLPDDHLAKILLCGSKAFNTISNKTILEISINFIKSSSRFKNLEAYSQIPP